MRPLTKSAAANLRQPMVSTFHSNYQHQSQPACAANWLRYRNISLAQIWNDLSFNEIQVNEQISDEQKGNSSCGTFNLHKSHTWRQFGSIQETFQFNTVKWHQHFHRFHRFGLQFHHCVAGGKAGQLNQESVKSSKDKKLTSKFK